MKKRTWAVIGGGNGGQTLVGHLGLMGEKARIYDVAQTTVDKLNELKKIQLHHQIEGVGEFEFATTDMAKALDGADNIIIVLPSIYHKSISRKIIPCLKDGMTILILPEATCGAFEFRKTMEEMGCNAKVVVGGSSNLIYATRAEQIGEVYIHGIKEGVPTAALPACDNAKLAENLYAIMPWLLIVESTLVTSIDNLNAMVHSGPTLLNTGRIEAKPYVPYQYYIDGFTPSICRYVECMDKERIAIAKELGFEQRTVKQEYIDMYHCGDDSMSFYEVITNNDGYRGIMAATSIHTRYVLEDVPYSLVPIAALGRVVGVKTPCIDAIIQIGRSMLGDEMNEGRTYEALGLDKMTKDDLLKFIFG